mgnify:FL=1
MYDDLLEWGLPLVVVDRWEDLSADLLEDKYKELKETTNWTLVRELFSVKHYKRLYLDSAT